MVSIVKTVEDKLYIKDEVKSHTTVMRMLIVVQFIACGLKLVNSNKTGFDFVSLIWVLLSLIFTWFAYLYFYKYTQQSVFVSNEIREIKIKKIFRQEEVYIALKNNKTRRISKKGLSQEIAIIKHWCEENQLPFKM